MNAVSPPPADDERVPPLTAQQLGLCGPRSDDPGVGPDAARHTPPADDMFGTTCAECGEPITDERPSVGEAPDGSGPMHAGCGEPCVCGTAFTCLAHDHEPVGPAEATELARSPIEVAERAMFARRDAARQAAEAGAPEPAQVVAAARRMLVAWTVGGDADTAADELEAALAEQSETGSVTTTPAAPGYPRIADAITAACEAADIDLTVVHDGRVLDYVPGVVWLATVLDKAGLIDWAAFADEAVDTAPQADALVAAARRVLAEWSRMHPSGYLAMYPAMDALRAALAAAPVAPALIGTYADPEFRAHQDHKHAVDGCGFCPSEEDR